MSKLKIRTLRAATRPVVEMLEQRQLLSTSALFTDGAGTSTSDQFTGVAGNGWSTAWTETTSNDAFGSATVASTGPLNGGGNYFTGTNTSTAASGYAAINRAYTTNAANGVDTGAVQQISFDFRVDSSVAAATNYNDRVRIFGDGAANASMGGTVTWATEVFGAVNNALSAGDWGFQNGAKNGSSSQSFVDSGVKLVTGTVYHFVINLTPSTKSYTASVTDGGTGTGHSYTSGTLGFATNVVFGSSTTTYINAGTERANTSTTASFSMDSLSISGTTTSAPAAPSGLTATLSSSTQAALSWTSNSTNQTGFKIERSTDGTNYTLLTTTASTATSYTDTGLADGTKYYYEVIATNSVGDSAASAAANTTTPLMSPTGLTATASGTQVALAWTIASTDQTGFFVQRSTDGTNFTTVTTTASTATSYTDTGLTAGTTYYYRVEAEDSTTTSPAASATAMLVPAAPASLTATAASSSQINLSWSDVTGETGFVVQRSPDGSTGWTQIATPSTGTTSYSDTGLTAATTYYYRVEATDSAGNSTWSTSAHVATNGVIPAAPSGLTATLSSSTQAALSWTSNSTNQTGFKVERSTDGTNYTLLTTTGSTATSYTDTGLADGTKFYYEVIATNSVGDSAASAAANVTTPLASPTGLTATASGTQVALAWTSASTDQTGFFVQRSTDGTNFTTITTTASTATSYTDTGLTAGTTYYYRVEAEDTAITSPAANATATLVPAAPGNLTATAASSSQINLSWSDVTGETGFVVQRSPDGSTGWTQIATPSTGTTTYSDSGLATATTYYYRIQANNSAGSSAWSTSAHVATNGVAPAAPSNLTATLSSSSQAALSWTSNSTNQTGFKIERSTDGMNYTLLTTTGLTATSYTDTGLADGTKYYYEVIATNSVGDSAASAAANATTPLASPTGLTATASGTQVALAWTIASTDQTGFFVQRSTDGTNFTTITTTASTATSYNDTGLTAGTTYYYRVEAEDSATNSPAASATATVPVSLPDNWQQGDVGAVGQSGSTTYSSDASSFTVRGSGTGLGGSGDAFQFAYQVLDGDGEITAELTSLAATSSSAQAGILFRNSLSAGSPGVALTLSQTGEADMAYRSSINGLSKSFANSTGSQPTWVRLSRQGNSFVGSMSTDGSSWTPVYATTIPMNETMYVGLTISSGDSESLATATFANATINTYGQSNPLTEGSFESPELTPGSYQYTPTGSAWTFSGNSGIETNGSAWNAANAPDGSQAVFLQGSGSSDQTDGQISQDVTLAAGSYSISFFSAQRSGYDVEPIEFQVDGTTIQTRAPSNTDFEVSSFAFTIASSGIHTVSLLAADSSTFGSSFVDNVQISSNEVIAVPPVTLNTNAEDGNFELPALSTGDYQYSPTGSPWTFSGNSGVEANGSAWGAANAPDGNQSAFLQGSGGNSEQTSGQISQDVTLAAGTYSLSFLNAQRTGYDVEPIEVMVDGSEIGETTPTTAQFSSSSLAFSVTTPGVHTVSLLAADSSTFGCSFVDDIEIHSISVLNAPSLFLAGSNSFTEGTQYSLALSQRSNGENQSTPDTWTIFWGDGSQPETVAGSTASLTHSFAQTTSAATVRAIASYTDGSYPTVNQLPVELSLAAPSQLVAVPIPAGIKLTWEDSSPSALLNEVDRSTDGVTWTTVTSTLQAAVTSYSDDSLSSSGQYYYRVRAIGEATYSAYVFSAGVTPLQPLPESPDSVSATAVSDTQATIAWNDSDPNVLTYDIAEFNAVNGTYVTVETINADRQSVTIDGLTPSTQYDFSVRANGVSGTQGYSEIASVNTDALIAPSAPLSLTTTATFATAAHLVWTDVDGATGYNILESLDGQNFTQVLTDVGQATADISALSPSTTYYFAVEAFNAGGTSVLSQTANVITPSDSVPETPTGVQISTSNDGQQQISWNQFSTNASAVTIEASDDGISFEPIANNNLSSNTYLVPAGSTSSYYRVTAVDADGSSMPSSTITAIGGPLNLNIAGGFELSGGVSLQWHSTSGGTEDGFRIEEAVEGGPFEQVGVAPQGANAFSVLGLVQSTHYKFRVTAFRGNLSSPAASVSFFQQPGYVSPEYTAYATAGGPDFPNVPSWFNNGESFPAGEYELTYVSDYLGKETDDTAGGGDLEKTYISTAGAQLVGGTALELPGLQPTYTQGIYYPPNHGSFVIEYTDTAFAIPSETVEFHHDGGPLGVEAGADIPAGFYGSVQWGLALIKSDNLGAVSIHAVQQQGTQNSSSPLTFELERTGDLSEGFEAYFSVTGSGEPGSNFDDSAYRTLYYNEVANNP